MKKYIAIMTMFLFVFVLGMRQAEAIPTLTIDDLSTVGLDVTVTDGDADGIVSYSGVVGTWLASVSTGITKPMLGSAASGILHLDTVDVSSSGGGTIVISFSETGFSAAVPTGISLAAGGVTSGSVSVSGYADASDAIFGTGTLIGSLGPFVPTAFSGTTGGIFGADPSFSMTVVASITHAGVSSTSINVEQKVPEPATLLLMGAGLLGLGIFGRKKIKR